MKTFAGAVAIGALLMASPALAQNTTFSGNIISHNGDQIVVRSGAGDRTVTLNPETKVEAVMGLTGIRRESHPTSDLIKGLAVNIEAVQNGDQLNALDITFKPQDLKTALAVQTGVAEAGQQIRQAQAENERRLSLVGQFDQIGKTSVYFATGSAALDAADKQSLQSIAAQAAQTPGAVLRVVGHTDSVGSAATNQRLSDQRASAVTAYLLRSAKVPPEKIITAGGLGETVPVDDEDTGNQAQNRRVTVFVLISKAAQGAATNAAAGAP